MRTVAAIATSALFGTLIFGCEPGYWLAPVVVPGEDRFVRIFPTEGVAVEISPISGFSHWSRSSPEFTIINLSSETVVLEGAELIANGYTYQAELPGSGELR